MYFLQGTQVLLISVAMEVLSLPATRFFISSAGKGGNPSEIRHPHWVSPADRSRARGTATFPFRSRQRLKDEQQHWWGGRDLPTSWTEPALPTTAFDQHHSYPAAAGPGGRNRSAWNWVSWRVQDNSGKCRKGVQTSYYWMLEILLRCFCSSSVGMVNEKVVKGSEFPEYLTVSAFLDPCWSGYRRTTAQRLHCTGSPGYRWISGLQDVIVRSISCLWCPEVLLSCFWSSARIDGTVLCSLFP